MIEVTMDDNQLQISNTSLLSQILPDKLFMRLNTFRNDEKPSNGIGLAIVKKIADINHLTIDYRADNGVHSFVLRPAVV